MTSMSYERASGHSTEYDVVDLGFNYRMDDIRSAIGIVQLDKIGEDLMKRARIRKQYIDMLSKIKGIIIPFKEYNEFSSNYIFPIILENSNSEKRDYIRNKLVDDGIQTSVHYPAVHRFTIYKSFYKELPKTDYTANNLITLPMYSNIGRNDIEFITIKIKKYVEEF